jgi:hypothetical protein
LSFCLVFGSVRLRRGLSEFVKSSRWCRSTSKYFSCAGLGCIQDWRQNFATSPALNWALTYFARVSSFCSWKSHSSFLHGYSGQFLSQNILCQLICSFSQSALWKVAEMPTLASTILCEWCLADAWWWSAPLSAWTRSRRRSPTSNFQWCSPACGCSRIRVRYV